MTGCFLFPEDLPNAAESASYLIMVKNAIEGKTQISDAYEAVVTSPSGRIAKNSFAEIGSPLSDEA